MSSGADSGLASEGRDFLALCVPATTGNPILEEVRDRSANAVLAIYRVVKTAIVHAADNEALLQTVERSHEILQQFTGAVGAPLALTFVGDTAFVNGQLVRAAKRSYELVWDLQALLRRCGVSEVVLDPELSAEELHRFGVTASVAIREATERRALLETPIAHVTVRQVDPLLEQRENDGDLALRERILRFYAAALLVLRRYFDEIARGVVPLPHRVKRIAQKLVTLSESGDPALLGLLTMTHAHRDDAGRALQGGILGCVLARQITDDRVTLSRIVMAALLADSGRVRIAGPAGRDRLVPLGDLEESAVPAITSAMLIATGGVNVATAHRTVACHEATWLEREELLGPLYARQRNAFVISRILRLVRAVLDRLAPRDTSAPLGPMDAVAAAAELPDMDSILVRLLVRAMGIIPIGTVVEFETGEWALVVGPSASADAFDRPTVQLLTDREGRALDLPKTVDLGAKTGARLHPRISHILPPDQTKFNLTRSFVS
jgi:hypothetical protein